MALALPVYYPRALKIIHIELDPSVAVFAGGPGAPRYGTHSVVRVATYIAVYQE